MNIYLIRHGDKMVSFNQGSIYRIRYADDALEVARYSEEESGFKEVIKLEK